MTYQSSIQYSDVKELELADRAEGTINGLWLGKLENTKDVPSSDLASILGISDFMAKIICNVKKNVNDNGSLFWYLLYYVAMIQLRTLHTTLVSG